MAPDPSETLTLILHHLLPIVLAASLSTRSFVTPWRLIHSNLSLLQSSLSTSLSLSNPLLLSLLPALLSTLHTLHALSTRCLDPTLPAGKLLLQSDLNIAAAALSRHLHDLNILLRSGLHNALILPDPTPSTSREDLALFIRDLFARLQIGSLDLKHKALDSLVLLLTSDPAKISPIIIQDGDVPALIRLLDSFDQAAAAVSLLATSSDVSRRSVFDEGGLGPLLRLLDTGSPALKEHAAAAVNAITADSSNAWAIAAYGGVPVLIEACRAGGGRSNTVRALAAGALKNISAMDDLRTSMADEGAVPVLIDLLATGTGEAKRNAVVCLWALASLSGEVIRVAIVEQGLQRILQLLHDATDPDLIEQTITTLHALSASVLAVKALSSSSRFFEQVVDLINRGSSAAQLTAAMILCDLEPTDEMKRSMGGCLGSLVKMLEATKPAAAQETAGRALVGLLSVRSNRKELARDEKSMRRLALMLDPRREEVCKTFVVAVVLAVAGGGGGCRKQLAAAGACQHLQKLAEADVPGAKKAVQKIAGGGRLKSLFSLSWRE